jgi:hypothetical protein
MHLVPRTCTKNKSFGIVYYASLILFSNNGEENMIPFNRDPFSSASFSCIHQRFKFLFFFVLVSNV